MSLPQELTHIPLLPFCDSVAVKDSRPHFNRLAWCHPLFTKHPLPLVFKKEIVKCPPTNFIFMVSFLFKSNYKRKNSICVVIQEREGKVQSKFWVLPFFFFLFCHRESTKLDLTVEEFYELILSIGFIKFNLL